MFTASGTEAANLALAPGVHAPGVGAARTADRRRDGAPLRAGRPSLRRGGDRARRRGRPARPRRARRRARRARRRWSRCRPPTTKPACCSLSPKPRALVACGRRAARLRRRPGGRAHRRCSRPRRRRPAPLGAQVRRPERRRRAGRCARGDAVQPLLRGGGQERGRRAGTENVAALAGFGAAAKRGSGASSSPRRRGSRALRDAMRGAAARDRRPTRRSSARARRACRTRSPSRSPASPPSTLLMRLDLEGVAVSSGSACSSGKVAVEPCAGGDGRRAGSGGGRDPRQPRLGVARR